MDTLKKLALYKTHPDIAKEMTPNEIADIAIILLEIVSKIEKNVKEGRLDGYTPVEGKDYVGRSEALKYLTDATNTAIASFDAKLAEKGSTLENQVSQAIQNIRDGENGIVTEEDIARAAELARSLIEVPDFEDMLTEAIQGNGALLRDALESLPKGEEQLKQESVQNLVEDLQSIRDAINNIAVKSGGTIGKQQVYSFIRQAIADGTITSGAGTGDVVGPSVAVDSNFAAFDTTTGKLLKDSGVSTATFAPALGADDNYVTDAEKVVIGNTSGTNTGDNAVNSNYSSLVTNATHTGDATGSSALTVVALNGTNLAALDTGVLKNTTITGVPFISKVTLTEPTTSATITATDGTTTTLSGGTHSGTNTGDQTLPTRASLGLDTTDSPQFAGVNVGHATDTTISRISAGVVGVEGIALASTLTTENAQTGTTYTLAITDASKFVSMSNASANTLTVPLNSSVAFPVGTKIMVQQRGAGSTTIAATGGVTINVPASAPLAIAEQYGSRVLYKTATDTWQLV